MYEISGVKAIATITELRAETSELLDYVREARAGMLIQKNNEPYAVLLDWETYQKLTGGSAKANGQAKHE